MVGDVRDIVRAVREAGAAARLNPLQARAVQRGASVHGLLHAGVAWQAAHARLSSLQGSQPAAAALAALRPPCARPAQAATSVLWMVGMPVLALFILRQFVLAVLLEVRPA